MMKQVACALCVSIKAASAQRHNVQWILTETILHSFRFIQTQKIRRVPGECFELLSRASEDRESVTCKVHGAPVCIINN